MAFTTSTVARWTILSSSVYGHTPMVYGHGQSDSPVVPAKSLNKTGRPVAEGTEGRGLAKGNSPQRNALRTQGRAGASTALERVREVAERDKTAPIEPPLQCVHD